MTKTNRREFLAVVGTLAASTRLGAEPLSSFRLGITTDEIDPDLEVAIEFLRRYGLRHAEIRNLWGKYNTELPVERIREARRLLESRGITTIVLDTGFFKIDLPADDAAGQEVLEAQWDLLDRAFERARILGTDTIRVFSFMNPAGKPPDADTCSRVYELVGESARRARAAGMRLAMENIEGGYVQTSEDLVRLLDAVPNEALGMAWDPNNAAASGEASPFPDGFRALDFSRIFHIHLRDYKRLPSGGAEWCGVGQGDFDNLGLLRTLLERDYRGTLALETHFRIDGSRMKGTEFSIRALLEVIREV